MTAQHTPGPWGAELRDHPTLVRAWFVISRGGGIVCALGGRQGRHTAANARLIAAAPRMLAALRALVSLPQYDQAAWDEAAAAIKDAAP